MKKIVYLTIPLIVLILLGILFLTINLNRPPDWQGDLNRYLQYKNTNSYEKYESVSTVKARTPWNFTAGMSSATFGESIYYQTDIRYDMETPDHEIGSLLSDVSPKSNLISPPSHQMKRGACY